MTLLSFLYIEDFVGCADLVISIPWVLRSKGISHNSVWSFFLTFNRLKNNRLNKLINNENNA